MRLCVQRIELKSRWITHNRKDVCLRDKLDDNLSCNINIISDVTAKIRISKQYLERNKVAMNLVDLVCHRTPSPTIFKFFTTPLIVNLFSEWIKNYLRNVTFFSRRIFKIATALAMLDFFVSSGSWSYGTIKGFVRGPTTGSSLVIGPYT